MRRMMSITTSCVVYRLRLMRAWPALYQVCSALVGSLYQIYNILILFLMMNVIFALLGMQRLRGKPRARESTREDPRPLAG